VVKLALAAEDQNAETPRSREEGLVVFAEGDMPHENAYVMEIQPRLGSVIADIASTLGVTDATQSTSGLAKPVHIYGRTTLG
jgi:hypothetical protein